MATAHGKGTVFKIDDVGGDLRDISAAVNNVDFPQTVDNAETSGMGLDSKTFLPGLAGATITVTGPWDDAATTGADVVLGGIQAAHGELSAGGSLSFEYGPEGGESADVRYKGECFGTGYQQTSPLGGAVTYSASFVVTGDVTRDTFGA